MFVALFHSVFGLRAVGHDVVVPDLFEGVTFDGDYDAGFAFVDRIGWGPLLERAHQALAGAPAETVLGGFSMGAALVGDVRQVSSSCTRRLPCRTASPPHSRPPALRRGRPLRAARSARTVPGDRRAGSRRRDGARVPGRGPFFTDETLPDHDAAAADRTWRDVIGMLDSLAQS